MAYWKKSRKGGKRGGKAQTKKRRPNKKKTLVDIGVTRPRITGEPGMSQN